MKLEAYWVAHLKWPFSADPQRHIACEARRRWLRRPDATEEEKCRGYRFLRSVWLRASHVRQRRRASRGRVRLVHGVGVTFRLRPFPCLHITYNGVTSVFDIDMLHR